MSGNRAIARYYDTMTVFYHGFYSRAGLHYGLWNRRTFTLRQALFNHKAALLTALSPAPASEVLDAGCGSGATALYFHRLTGCGVTGITLSVDQIRRAQRAASRQRAGKRVRFVQGDFARTGLPGASFSHALTSESLCHAPDKGALLRELFRLLRPGGRLVIADFFLERAEERLNATQRYYHSRVKAGFVIPGFITREELYQHARSSGFRVTGDVDWTRSVQRTAYHIQLRALLTLPLGWLLRRLRLAPPELMPHLRCCAVQPAALRHLGTYRLITLDKPD
jgi:tocopherol O-methyltransferase